MMRRESFTRAIFSRSGAIKPLAAPFPFLIGLVYFHLFLTL